MALEVKETSGKLFGRPKGGYTTSFPTVKSNHLGLVNVFTKDRRNPNRKVPLTPDRNLTGHKGGRQSSNAGLRAKTNAGRTIVP